MFIRNACTAITFVSLLARLAEAQETGFVVGHYYAGAVIGAGGIHGAALSYGIRIEKAVAPLEDLGDAVLGVQIVADRYSYHLSSGGHSYRITRTIFSAAATYHLFVEDKRWDPFVGLGLGHDEWNEKALDFGQPIPFTSSFGVFFVLRAGFRYYFTPGIAGFVDAGGGAASLNGGVSFKVR